MQIILHNFMKTLHFYKECIKNIEKNTKTCEMHNKFLPRPQKYIEKSDKLLYKCTVKGTLYGMEGPC